MMSEKTNRLLEDYERLKFESERLKVENRRLLREHQSTQLNSVGGSTLECEPVHVLSHFNSKDLSVADLTDSVGALNAKLEEKNQYLEDQLHLMQQHMADLAEQTRQMKQEREAFE